MSQEDEIQVDDGTDEEQISAHAFNNVSFTHNVSTTTSV